jgi:hypothetical protein
MDVVRALFVCGVIAGPDELDCCELCLAPQRLGWSAAWSPLLMRPRAQGLKEISPARNLGHSSSIFSARRRPHAPKLGTGGREYGSGEIISANPNHASQRSEDRIHSVSAIGTNVRSIHI